MPPQYNSFFNTDDGHRHIEKQAEDSNLRFELFQHQPDADYETSLIP